MTISFHKEVMMTRAKSANKTEELLDELLEGFDSLEDIYGKHGL